ncbi:MULTISPECIES: plasmid partitioning protein [unclassified Rothia (in: high G+C Gram-positive bacteria)]|uniref:plasmid partitioning protein n=1 Tax=unclassified Rothia (in: high G+C Gram-positive bacteria) TaxID=2689056 RepID=UPI00244AD612|nr:MULTISPECIES: plasmid partitioning protein [unclassified Rothia (in: high G+C Gram-positive bacteria)]
MRAPFSGTPKASLTSKALTACAAATLALGLGVGTASALPPGGAKASTDNTSSTVSPSVSEHGVISFSVSGFPANAVVSVKVDDGNLCPSNAAQGACVVHQQKTDGNGNVSGSFVLPDVGPGTHTLRFLASREKRDKDGKYLGTEAYSNRSPEFTVVGENGSESSNSSSRRSGSDDSANSQSDESNAEAETVYTDADGNTITKEEYDRLNVEADSSAAPAASASANAQKKATASASASSSAVARGNASNPSASASGAANTASTVQTVTYGAAFPWIGVVVLGVSVVGAAALLLTRKR